MHNTPLFTRDIDTLTYPELVELARALDMPQEGAMVSTIAAGLPAWITAHPAAFINAFLMRRHLDQRRQGKDSKGSAEAMNSFNWVKATMRIDNARDTYNLNASRAEYRAQRDQQQD